MKCMYWLKVDKACEYVYNNHFGFARYIRLQNFLVNLVWHESRSLLLTRINQLKVKTQKSVRRIHSFIRFQKTQNKDWSRLDEIGDDLDCLSSKITGRDAWRWNKSPKWSLGSNYSRQTTFSKEQNPIPGNNYKMINIKFYVCVRSAIIINFNNEGGHINEG